MIKVLLNFCIIYSLSIMFIALLVDFANATTTPIQDTEPSPNENATNTVSLPSLDLSNNISESDTVNLSDNKGTSSSPIIHTSTTAANNDLYVLWSDNSTGNFDVFYKRSIDGGSTFEDTVNLSNNTGDSVIPTDSSIVSIDGNLYVIWIDDTTGISDVFYKRSTDGGSTFEDTVNLSNNLDILQFIERDLLLYSSDPQIKLINDDIIIIWQQHMRDQASEVTKIFAKINNNTGGTFSNAFDLSNTPLDASNPQLIGNNDFVFYIWQDNSPIGFDTYNIFSRISTTNNGFNFSDMTDLSNSRNPSINPEIALTENNLAIVWEELTPIGNEEVFFKTISVNRDPSINGARPAIGNQSVPDTTTDEGTSLDELF